MKLIMDGEGNIYTSIAEAEAHTGIPHQNISSVLAGKRHTAGGVTWARVEAGKDSPLTYEDMVNNLYEEIEKQASRGTPRQKAAAERARTARKAYKDTVEKARSVGLLFYHLPKSAGKRPSNKKIHEYSLKNNPDYKEYYDQLTGDSEKISDVDFGRLDW